MKEIYKDNLKIVKIILNKQKKLQKSDLYI